MNNATLVGLMMTVLGGLVSAPALASDPLEPCPTEDSYGCKWDAGVRGNGRGRSFIALPSGKQLWAGSYDYAQRVADACDTATGWAEQVAPGLWRGVCGDDQGHELISSAAESALLAWHISGGSDAAYEDALAAYAALDDRGELPCYGTHPEPDEYENECQARASRAWNKAHDSAGNADAAYEDVYALCMRTEAR